MTQLYMQLPIKACNGCLASYDLEEWALLPLLEMASEPCDHGPKKCDLGAHVVERRKCTGRGSGGVCSKELRLDLSATERMQTEITVEEFQRIYPGDTRYLRRAYTLQEAWRLSFRQRLALVVAAAVVALLALALLPIVGLLGPSPPALFALLVVLGVMLVLLRVWS